MQLPVYTPQGQPSGSTVELDDTLYNVDPSEHSIYLDVKQYLAAQRQGTTYVKGKGEVRGSTRKLFKQKGTGGARRGQLRSPLMRKGGTVHGPTKRNYDFKLNKKVKRLARRSAFSMKLRSNNLFVVNALEFSEVKTKQMVKVLNDFNFGKGHTLVLTSSVSDNVYKSARNIPNVSVIPAEDVNTYALMRAQRLLVVAEALPLIDKVLGKE